MLGSKAHLLVCFAALAGSVAACGATDAPAVVDFAGASEVSVAGSAGNFVVAVRSSPSPPVRGTNAFRFDVTEARTKRPVEGLALTVTPFMPAMGHGTSVVPVISAEGGGVYVARDVSLFMPGRWELRVVLHGDADDAIAPAWDIP